MASGPQTIRVHRAETSAPAGGNCLRRTSATTAESFGQIPGYTLEAPPLFFGHYLKPGGSPLVPERHNVACLDRAAAKDGPLVAYRWKGESESNPNTTLRHMKTDLPTIHRFSLMLMNAPCSPLLGLHVIPIREFSQ